MKILKYTLLSSLIYLISSCSTSKKPSTSTDLSIIPGEAQLNAIKVKYPNTNAEQLKEGYSIYTGACTNCHGQKNIFKRSEASWLHEIEDMSPKAKLTDLQKDALTKYILSMKATQASDAK